MWGCLILGDPQNGGFSFGFPLENTKAHKKRKKVPSTNCTCKLNQPQVPVRVPTLEGAEKGPASRFSTHDSGSGLHM